MILKETLAKLTNKSLFLPDLLIPAPVFERGDWVKNKNGFIYGKVENIRLELNITTKEGEVDRVDWLYGFDDQDAIYPQEGLYACTETEIEEHLKWLEEDEKAWQEELKAKGKK